VICFNSLALLFCFVTISSCKHTNFKNSISKKELAQFLMPEEKIVEQTLYLFQISALLQ